VSTQGGNHHVTRHTEQFTAAISITVANIATTMATTTIATTPVFTVCATITTVSVSATRPAGRAPTDATGTCTKEEITQEALDWLDRSCHCTRDHHLCHESWRHSHTCSHNAGHTTPTQASQPTAQPTLAPTPTAQPTSAPTKAPTIGSQVVVGGTEDAFTAKFGNPTSQQTQNGAQELDYATGDATIGQFGIVLWPDTRTVYGLVIAAPTGQPWDAITAIPLCINYLPGDVTLDQPKNITDTAGNVVGLFQSGYSTELANTLNPAYFNDAIGNNLVKPGTFSIRYTYTDSSGTASNLCTIRLGMQSTSA